MWKKKSAIIIVFLIMLCCGCSRTKEGNDNAEPGGYVESVVELPVTTIFSDFVQGEEGIRLIDIGCNDLITEDGGEQFREGEAHAAVEYLRSMPLYGFKGASNGSRIFYRFTKTGEQVWVLATVEDGLMELEKVSGMGDQVPKFFYGAGYFYALYGNSVYWIDADTGEIKLLTECTGYPLYLAAGQEMVYIVCQDGLVLYDLEKGGIAAQQDEVLSAFVSGRDEILMYPCEAGIYVASYEGVYWHELYGDSMEQLVDGGMCRLCNRDRKLVGMAVVGQQDQKSILIYGLDGVLLRYDYDETYVPVQNAIRVYSLYEDSQVRRGVVAFREQYPDIPVKYEIGISGGYGMTEEDALKNLATELAAGQGPDVLVMDDIPYRSYLEKGVLMELGEIREGMTEEEYFNHIIDAAGTEEGVYMVPVSFVLPVLAGQQEAIRGIESLPELADLLESAGNEKGGSVIGVVRGEEMLSLLAQSSMGAWVSPEGILNLDSIREFLIEAKRIYEIQMKGVPEELSDVLTGKKQEESVLKRRFGELGQGDISIASYQRQGAFPEQPFFAGYLGTEYAYLNGWLKYDGSAFCMLPGQNYGTCIPVSLLAVNAATKVKEESCLFVEYMLSEEFQKKAALSGLPINRKAYFEKQKNPHGEMFMKKPYYTDYVTGAFGREVIQYEIYWPTKEEFEELDKVVEAVKGVNICENKVYDMVISQGKKVLDEDLSVEEGVRAIEKVLQIYLSE